MKTEILHHTLHKTCNSSQTNNVKYLYFWQPRQQDRERVKVRIPPPSETNKQNLQKNLLPSVHQIYSTKQTQSYAKQEYVVL